MPRFFFTLSFLKSFFQKYQDGWFDGIPQENKESFIRFLRCQTGHILIDDTIADLENYPHLYSIIEPSTTSYRPFMVDDKVPVPVFIPEELNCEYQAIISHTASFTNSLNPDVKIKLKKKHYKPIFDQDDVEKKFGNLLKTINPKKNVNYKWADILAPFNFPTGSIIISDNYLPTRSDRIIGYNLIPILDFFSSLKLDEIPVIILSATKANINYKFLKQSLEQRLDAKYSQYLKIEIVFVEGGLKTEHDRRIITDTMSMSIPHGLDLFNSRKSLARGTTEPSIISFFDGKIENSEHLVFLKKEIKKSIDEGRVQYESR